MCIPFNSSLLIAKSNNANKPDSAMLKTERSSSKSCWQWNTNHCQWFIRESVYLILKKINSARLSPIYFFEWEIAWSHLPGLDTVQYTCRRTRRKCLCSLTNVSAESKIDQLSSEPDTCTQCRRFARPGTCNNNEYWNGIQMPAADRRFVIGGQGIVIMWYTT